MRLAMARRMSRRSIASFFLFSFLVACDDNPGTIFVSADSVEPPVVGVPASVSIRAFHFDCEEEKSFSRGTETRCEETNIPLGDVTAGCDDGGCDVTVAAPRRLVVVGRKAGPTILRVHGRDDDGRDWEGWEKLTFRAR